MADVARVAGVSVMTVSYVYSQPGRVSAHAAEKWQLPSAANSTAQHRPSQQPHPIARIQVESCLTDSPPYCV